MALDTQNVVWLGGALVLVGIFILALSLWFHDKKNGAPAEGFLLLGPLPVSLGRFRDREALAKVWLIGLALLFLYAAWLFFGR